MASGHVEIETLPPGIFAHLRPAQVLLVIDNCEHLLDALDPLVATLPA